MLARVWPDLRHEPRRCDVVPPPGRQRLSRHGRRYGFSRCTLPADVAAKQALRPVDAIDGPIGTLLRSGDVVPEAQTFSTRPPLRALPRLPHPAPTSVTTAKRPSCGRETAAVIAVIGPTA
jgi:hypothetical protein